MSEVEPAPRRRLPEDLPPVEPPSAKLIAQLFLVPGVIVMGIVVVWLVINKIASSEQDWRGLVRGVENTNEHERWRSAYGLAQLLQSDQSAPPDHQKLVNNPELAGKLAEMLHKELSQPAKGDRDVEQRAFLARTLGLFRVADAVLPTLGEALNRDQDRVVRKNSLGAIAMIAGRGFEAGQPLKKGATLDLLIDISGETDPLFRQMAAYTLGLASDPAATKRLEILITDEDRNTKANAAIALARQASTAAIPPLKALVQELATPTSTANAKARDAYEDMLIAKNGLAALQQLSPKMSPEQRQELAKVVEPLTAGSMDSRIRVDAENLLISLRQGK